MREKKDAYKTTLEKMYQSKLEMQEKEIKNIKEGETSERRE